MSFRGEIAIHAAKGFPGWAKDFCNVPVVESALWTPEELGPHRLNRALIKSLPLGAVVAVAQLVHVMPTAIASDGWGAKEFRRPEPGTPEHTFGDYSPGRFMWFLENIRSLPEPVPCRGALSLWDVPEDVEAQVREQLKRAA